MFAFTKLSAALRILFYDVQIAVECLQGLTEAVMKARANAILMGHEQSTEN